MKQLAIIILLVCFLVLHKAFNYGLHLFGLNDINTNQAGCGQLRQDVKEDIPAVKYIFGLTEGMMLHEVACFMYIFKSFFFFINTIMDQQAALNEQEQNREEY